MLDLQNFKHGGRRADYFMYAVRRAKGNEGNRARKKNPSPQKSFNITATYLKSIFPIDHRCPILGIDFSFNKSKMEKPSLDRINNSKGYVKGNVIWISTRANLIKNDVDAETLLKIVEFYRKLENAQD